jgi:hypothetical protein
MGWYQIYSANNFCMTAERINSSIISSYCDYRDYSQKWYFYSYGGYYSITNYKFNGALQYASNLYLNNASAYSSRTRNYYRFRFNSGSGRKWAYRFQNAYGRCFAMTYNKKDMNYRLTKCHNLKRFQEVSCTSNTGYYSTSSLAPMLYSNPLMIRNRARNLCLNAANKGNQVQFTKCKKNKKEQIFHIEYVNSSYVSIRNRYLNVALEYNSNFRSVKKNYTWGKYSAGKSYQRFIINKKNNSFAFFNSYITCIDLKDGSKNQSTAARSFSFDKNWRDKNQHFDLNYINPLVSSKDLPLKKWVKIISGELCLTRVGSYYYGKLCDEFNRSQSFMLERVNKKFILIKNKESNKYIKNYSNLVNDGGKNSNNYFYIRKNGKYHNIFSKKIKCINRSSVNYYVNNRNCNNNDKELWKIKIEPELKKTSLPYNTWVSIINSYSKKCLSTSSKTGNLVQSNCRVRDEKQHWKIILNKNNSVYIKNRFFSFIIQQNSSYYKSAKKNSSSHDIYIKNDQTYKKQFLLRDDFGKCFSINSTSNNYNLRRVTCDPSKYTNFSFKRAPETSTPPKIYIDRWLQIKDYSGNYCLHSQGTSYARMYSCSKTNKVQHWKFILDKKTNKVLLFNRHFKTYLTRYSSSQYFISHTKSYNLPLSQKLFDVKSYGDFFKIRSALGYCFRMYSTNYLYRGTCKKSDNYQKIFPVPIVPFVHYNDYKPTPKIEVTGSFRVKGKCLEINDKDEAYFDKCEKDGKNQMFMFIGNFNNAKIATPDRKKYLKITKKVDGFSQLGFADLNPMTFKVKKMKYGFFNLMSTNSKQCIISPYSKNLITSYCHQNLQLGKFKFLRKGFSPEENGLKNKEYDNRNKSNLKGFYQIRSARGYCLKEVASEKPLSIAKCEEEDRKFFFQIKKDGNMYKLATATGFISKIKNENSIISSAKSKDNKFNIARIEGTYMISTGDKMCFTEKMEGGESTLYLSKCTKENIEQGFAIVGYQAVYDN